MPDFNERRELYSGLIRLHLLHHACHEPIFGLGMIEELARHGYRLSPGTLYPMLDSMEKNGLLRSSRRLVDGKRRRVYVATATGRKALHQAKIRVKELFGELFEDEKTALPAAHPPAARARGSAGSGRSSVSDG